MILTKQMIQKEMQSGKIAITPFNPDNLNPNSYNLTLSDKLLMLEGEQDCKKPACGQQVILTAEGYTLEPGKIYLAVTKEYTQTHGYVPVLFGRSSLSRLGLSVHCTGGFGDIGFCGNWTLTLNPAVPVKIYPDLKICQIVYFSALGDISEYNSQKYQYGTDIEPSKLYKELT